MNDIDLINLESYLSYKYYNQNWNDLIGHWPLTEVTGLKDISENDRHVKASLNAAYPNISDIFGIHNSNSCLDFNRTTISGNVHFPIGNYVYNQLADGEQWTNSIVDKFTMTLWWSVDGIMGSQIRRL